MVWRALTHTSTQSNAESSSAPSLRQPSQLIASDNSAQPVTHPIPPSPTPALTSSLTPDQIQGYGKNRTETKSVKLENPVPVELRYETIVGEPGALRIYRDVYERGTNTLENAK
ncbi:hypothetical protein EON64_02515, partial [archaeon]